MGDTNNKTQAKDQEQEPPNRQAWDVLNRTVLVEAWPWVRVCRDHVRLPNNVEIDDFYRVEMLPFVKIFALTPQQEVILVELYKHGPEMVSLELPAGGIEEGSTPLENAQRELLEETGMVATHWKCLGEFFIDGNRGCGSMVGFLATDARYQQEQQLEPAEILQVHRIPLAKVRELWMTGKIKNVTSVALIGLALAKLEIKAELKETAYGS